MEPTLMQLAVAEAYKISIGEVFHMWETTMVHELDPARPGYFSNKLALDAGRRTISWEHRRNGLRWHPAAPARWRTPAPPLRD